MDEHHPIRMTLIEKLKRAMLKEGTPMSLKVFEIDMDED